MNNYNNHSKSIVIKLPRNVVQADCVQDASNRKMNWLSSPKL
jgi:hypothetical protein